MQVRQRIDVMREHVCTPQHEGIWNPVTRRHQQTVTNRQVELLPVVDQVTQSVTHRSVAGKPRGRCREYTTDCAAWIDLHEDVGTDVREEHRISTLSIR